MSKPTKGDNCLLMNLLNDDPDYKFFNEIYNFENKINKLFTPDYSLEIKLSNYDDNIFVTVKTNKMPKIQDLPQSISELINKYDILKHYISCYTDDFYLHFDLRFICSSGECFKQFYSISVVTLKKMFIPLKIL